MRIVKNLRLLGGVAVLTCFVFAWLRFDTFGPAATLLEHTQMAYAIFELPLISAAIALIAITLTTLLVGRVYCSTLCPLGLLQDLIARLTRRFNKKPYQKLSPYSSMHALIFALAAASAVGGFVLPLAIIEPFSTFGQIFAGIFQPLAARFFSATAPLLSTGINWFGQASAKPFSLLNSMISVLLLAGLTIAVYKAGRIYCNTICPVGAILRFTAKYSIFRLAIDDSACTSCRLCEKFCKAGCIDVAQKNIDFSRCVSCYNCYASCNFAAIKFGRPAATAGEKPDFMPGRRAAIATIAGGVAGYVLPKALPAASQSPAQILPPGAMTAERFYQSCISCHLCVIACPSSVIQPHSTPESPRSLLKPALNFDLGMCEQNCNLCSQICPVNAIQPVAAARKKLMKIGEVEYKKHLCVVETDGKDCGACAEHCPTQAVRMVPYHNNLMIPQTDPAICIGCGSCEHICPVRPDRAIIVHPVAQQTFIEMPEPEALPDGGQPAEFPF
ncbi:MAG TPA: hypothetical protein DCG57_20740 [Candidatus Riflebacteria bacterium]|jgi:ferredoxin|nr:hypothetical protein [Candidatus Riflebacteria bacterium]